MNWKTIGLVVLLVGAAGFVAFRWRTGFRASTPATLKVEERSSPAMWTDGQLRRSWAQLERMLKQVGTETNTANAALRSIQFVAVTDGGRDALFWDLRESINPGFAPLERLEVGLTGRAPDLVGFYGLDGTPLTYLSREDPRRPNTVSSSIRMVPPVPPGATGQFFRVSHEPARVATNKAGEVHIHLGRLPGPAAGVCGRGVALPGNVKLGEYRPQDSAFYARNDDEILIFWFNSVVSDDNPPLIVTFSPNR